MNGLPMNTYADYGTSLRFVMFAWAISEPPARYGADVSSSQAPRILVVGDHAGRRFVLTEQLKALGVDPLGVEDGWAALQALAHQRPDMILILGPMAGMDGYAITWRIRQWEARQGIARIPIMAVCDVAQAAQWERCLEDGVDGVLKAPLRVEELKATLEMWLVLPFPPSHEPSGAQLFSENVPRRYQASMNQDLDAFEQALNHGDTVQMAHFAHRLKGAALVLYMEPAARLADQLEQAARGERTCQPAQLRQMLRNLKEAVARHFEQSGRTH